MLPEKKLLKKLCSKPETIAKAEVLLHIAKAKTRAGSGHGLRDGGAGLPAVCAFIASVQLNNDDVSQNIAQEASCLSPKLFKATLASIRSLVNESIQEQAAIQSSATSSPTTYAQLMKRHGIAGSLDLRRKFLGWMEEVESTVLESDLVKGRYERQQTLVRCAVFAWTCARLKIERQSLDDIVPHNHLPQRAFTAFLKVLDKSCEAVGSRIFQELGAERRLRSRSSSPTKKSPSKSPQKPEKTVVIVMGDSQSPSKNVGEAQKENVVEPASTSAENSQTLGGPSPNKKRRLVTSPSEPQPTKRRLRLPTTASSSRVTLDDTLPEVRIRQPSRPHIENEGRNVSVTSKATSRIQWYPRPIEEDESESEAERDEDPKPTVTRRRFRPVFLDQRQWSSRDPGLERIWREAEAHKKEMVKSHGHPLVQVT